jgi:iron complex outermembrane receptor protein
MRVKRVAVSVRLGLMVVLAGGLVGGWAVPGQFSRAEALPVPERREPTPTAERPEAVGVSEAVDRTAVPASEQASASVSSAEVLPLSELEQPATTVTEWVAQIEASLVQITEVRVEQTEAGLQMLLETENGVLDVPETRSVGNALIADIANATIAEEFSQVDPIEGIALVNVTSLPGDRVRVAITGTDAPPVAEVRSDGGGLVFGVAVGTVAADEEEAIEIVVTGDQDEGYNPSNATTATRTDTPLRDIPQSITVVPREVLDDRDVRNINEALETVSGVTVTNRAYGGALTNRTIRGFDRSGLAGTLNFRNGVRDGDFLTLFPIETVEQVEVLRGPASVLFGAGEPGGVVNVITRQPLDEPYYEIAFEAGSFALYQPSIDLSGSLTEDDTLLYRFIAGYRGSGEFQGVADSRLATIAPSITLNLGERTDLNLYYEYSQLISDPAYLTNAAILSDGSLTPRDFITYYPDLSSFDITTQRFGYALEHEFSDSLQLRSNVALSLNQVEEDVSTGFELVDDQFLNPFQAFSGTYSRNNYFGQIDLLGEFETGAIAHQVLIGFDYNYFRLRADESPTVTDLPLIDIRNPNYDIAFPEFSDTPFETDVDVQSRGIYIQDQIAFGDLRLLIGGRYDWVTTDFESDYTPNALETQNDGAFSPRVGLVYQPSDTLAFYASYTRSFNPVALFDNSNGQPSEPTRGTQYEVGLKADFLEGRLSTTLAAYHLTRTNVNTPDPENPTRSIQTGEQRSQGVEFDIAGEILPGWNITAAYAYTDAEVVEDNTFPVGNRLPNAPEHQASLWTTYTIQQGDLQGLGFGLGLFYVGERQGDLNNSFDLDDYLRTDAALYYRRGRFNAAINVRNLFDIDEVAFASSRAYVQRTEPFTIVGSISWEF